MSPAFYGLHGASYSVFEPGGTASTGLERLAEDGDPTELVSEALDDDVQADAAGDAPVPPGDSLEFTVTPTDDDPLLSFATMIVESNDVVIATPPGGIALLDDDGSPRSASSVQTELRRRVAIWDAGTEANEVPGVGPNQPQRQSAPD
ncbi:MAG: spondin domain-containing protein, partial [Pseudolabrys sp.]